MDYLLKKFLPQIEFKSYEEFREKLSINVPEDFNFGYDVVDAWAKEEPDKKALVWVNEEDEEHIFTFTEIMKKSNQVANYLKGLGFRKGDVVMMILRRRWEYWICATALHKLGVILIPATLQLTKKDIVYRGNAAEVKGMICVDDDFVVQQTELAAPEIPSLKYKFLVGEKREGWERLHDARYYAGLFHERHHGHAEAGSAQLRLSAGPHRHREILAARRGEPAAHERIRLRLG